MNETFTPSAAEVDHALRVMDLSEASETGLVVLDGKLIEPPVIRAMRRRLAIAEAAGVLTVDGA